MTYSPCKSLRCLSHVENENSRPYGLATERSKHTPHALACIATCFFAHIFVTGDVPRSWRNMADFFPPNVAKGKRNKNCRRFSSGCKSAVVQIMLAHGPSKFCLVPGSLRNNGSLRFFFSFFFFLSRGRRMEKDSSTKPRASSVHSWIFEFGCVEGT